MSSVETIHETCSCGAKFDWTGSSLNAARRLSAWRSEHRHVEPSEPERVCDHPGLDHNHPFAYCWPCPKCGVCKFIGHGPLCGDCIPTATEDQP